MTCSQDAAWCSNCCSGRPLPTCCRQAADPQTHCSGHAVVTGLGQSFATFQSQHYAMVAELQHERQMHMTPHRSGHAVVAGAGAVVPRSWRRRRHRQHRLPVAKRCLHSATEDSCSFCFQKCNSARRKWRDQCEGPSRARENWPPLAHSSHTTGAELINGCGIKYHSKQWQLPHTVHHRTQR